MDWQMIGAVGEILGALGVIATLGYLASQIRASTRASQARAAGELLSLNQAYLAQLSRSVEDAALWRRGMAADPEMTDDEVFQFHAVLLQLVMMWQRGYHLERTGDGEPWFYESLHAGRRLIAPAPGFARWFSLRGQLLTQEFREVLERDMAARSGYAPLSAGTDEVAALESAAPGTT